MTTPIELLREAWATLHNLSADMEQGGVRQQMQMQKRAVAIRQYLDTLEQPDGTYAPDMLKVCEALGFDPTNHHNAAKCPYCTPTPQYQCVICNSVPNEHWPPEQVPGEAEFHKAIEPLMSKKLQGYVMGAFRATQQATPMYQIKFEGETPSTWHDASEEAYHTTMPQRRRILWTRT